MQLLFRGCWQAAARSPRRLHPAHHNALASEGLASPSHQVSVEVVPVLHAAGFPGPPASQAEVRSWWQAHLSPPQHPFGLWALS